MSQVRHQKIEVVPTNASLGADIRGVDLRDVSDADFAVIEDAWHQHSVIRFRGQQIDDDVLVAFSKRFGKLDMAPTGKGGKPFDPLRPEVTVLSNIVVNGVAAGGLGNSELVWHQDMTYLDVPPKASLLYSMIVPEHGGDTSFYDMYRAFETLPDDLKERIQGLRCKHDATRNSAGGLRYGFDESYDNESRPGAIHPLVIRHPATGRSALFLGRRPNAWIVGFADADSDALLDALWAHIHNNPFFWTQQWAAGDLILWDNRCTLHRRDQFDQQMKRLLHRTQVGDSVRPVAA